MALVWKGAIALAILLHLCNGDESNVTPMQDGGVNGWAADSRLRMLPRGPEVHEATTKRPEGGEYGWSNPLLRGGPPREPVDPDLDLREDVANTVHIGEFTALYCSGGELDMECPAGYTITVKEGFWGRKRDADVCSDGKTLTYNCENRHALQKITTMCSGVNRCAFNIDENLFGSNPCYGYNHYLNVTYSCQMHQYNTVSCDGDLAKLQCYRGQAITVIDAKYGRTSGDDSTCLLDEHDNNECSNRATLTRISQLSNGREWVEIEASAEFFDDSCPDTAKYLNITYTCADCVIAWDSDADCVQWAFEGQCVSNPDWMHAHCRRTCTHCDKSDQCMNTFYGHEDLNEQCGEWARQGECYNNHDWMRDNCEESCADQLCNIWASRGECILSEQWMSRNCARSCNLCNVGLERTPPERKENQAWKPFVATDNLQIKVATACYGADALLGCPPGEHIRVFGGFFGRAEGSQKICPQTNNTQLSMICDKEQGETFRVASRHCDGRSACYLECSTATLHDACPESSVQERYLQIQYTCQSCENAYGDDEKCASWRSSDECQNNPSWMNTNCFQDCSSCSSDGDCNNVEDDATCDYWAVRGECSSNADYMKLNCANSCRTC